MDKIDLDKLSSLIIEKVNPIVTNYNSNNESNTNSLQFIQYAKRKKKKTSQNS